MTEASSEPKTVRTSSTLRSKLAHIVGSGVLLLFSFGFAAMVAELAVRMVAPQQLILIRPDIWLPVDSLGWMHRPGLDTQVNTGEGPARLITDESGFRRGESPSQDPDAEVLLIGDSFMAALQVNHEETLAGLMEDGLSSALGRPVAVRNAGVGAWDPSHYLIRARTLLSDHPYQLMVVAVYVGNDVVSRKVDYFPAVEPVAVSRLRLPRDASRGEVIDAVLRPVNDYLETRSHLFTMLRSRLEVLRMRLGLTAAYFPEGFRLDEADDSKWNVTLEILEEIAEMADAEGVPTLFLLLPADFQVDAEAFERHVTGFGLDAGAVDLEQPNRILREGLLARGVNTIDALPTFKAAWEGGTRGFGTVDTHFNAAGHRLVWEASSEAMVALLQSDATASVEGHRQVLP